MTLPEKLRQLADEIDKGSLEVVQYSTIDPSSSTLVDLATGELVHTGLTLILRDPTVRIATTPGAINLPEDDFL